MTPSERRLIENEVVFRRFNESIQEGIDQVNELAMQEGHQLLQFDANTMLHFYCECSDENCTKRIRLRPSDYNKIHAARDTFTIICGHEVGRVERIIKQNKDYCIVKKYVKPPESITGLNTTEVNNV